MRNKAVEIGTIWGPAEPYDPNDPFQRFLDGLGEVQEIQLRYVQCNVLSVMPLPEQIHVLSGIIYPEKITYLPLELKVSSTEKVEVIHFNLHPKYKTSLIHRLPLQAGDDIKALLPYFIKHSGSEEFGSGALELEKKVGEDYNKIESAADYKLPKELPIRPETLLMILD